MPIPQINAGKYVIRVKGIDMSFDDEFEDIYIELPLTIEQFVKQALENEDDYPYDGFSADKYMDNL